MDRAAALVEIYTEEQQLWLEDRVWHLGNDDGRSYRWYSPLNL